MMVVDSPGAEKKPAFGANSLFNGFLLTYVLTVGGFLAAAFLWGKVGASLLVVAMGWPHVVLGLIFNVNRVKAADLKGQLAFFGLLVVAFTIGFVHTQVPITTLIYLYFIFHAFRDEIFIYHQRNTGYRFRGEVFDRRGITWLISAIAMSLPGQVLARDPARQLEWYYVLCGASGVLAATVLLAGEWKLFQQWPGARYGIAAYFLIVAAMTGMRILRVRGIAAPLFFSFLVVFHYFSWYVFTLEKIAARPQPKPGSDGSFSFMKWISTWRGFVTAIAVMNVFSFACAYAYQVRHVSASLGYGFDLKYFLYFLVLHVTTSFVPKNLVQVAKVKPAAAA